MVLKDGINEVDYEMDLSNTTVTIQLGPYGPFGRYKRMDVNIRSCDASRSLDPANDKTIGKSLNLNLPLVVGGSVGGVFIILIIGLMVYRMKRGSGQQEDTSTERTTELQPQQQTSEDDDGAYDYMFHRTDRWDYYIKVRYLLLSTSLILVFLIQSTYHHDPFRMAIQMWFTRKIRSSASDLRRRKRSFMTHWTKLIAMREKWMAELRSTPHL